MRQLLGGGRRGGARRVDADGETEEFGCNALGTEHSGSRAGRSRRHHHEVGPPAPVGGGPHAGNEATVTGGGHDLDLLDDLGAVVIEAAVLGHSSSMPPLGRPPRRPRSRRYRS